MNPSLLIYIFFRAVVKKFLQEDDDVIHARILALLQLFETANSEVASQMILNALDTYKKHLIYETELQNKLSCRTMEILIKALLTVLCFREEHDHLHSMVSKTIKSVCFCFVSTILFIASD